MQHQNEATKSPSYGPLVEVCARYGIRRSKAFQLAAAGMIETFPMGGRRFVYIHSLESLPERYATQAKEAAARNAGGE